MTHLLQNYDFDDAEHGKGYDQITFDLPQEDAYLLTDAKIYMQLRKKPGKSIAAEFSTINGLIVITGNYSFVFEEINHIEIDPDTYWYDILIIFQSGRRDKPIGGTWKIGPSITHKP